jgi:hypothetical protein
MNSDARSGYSQNYQIDDSSNSRTAAGAHARNDSAMSNFASRPSREILAGTRESRYDATSRNPVLNAANADDFNPEAGWNVYSDFNNTGPRYSDLKTTADGYAFLVLWYFFCC